MNPVITLSKNLITFALDAKDQAKLAATELIHGSGTMSDHLNHRMCVMQATSMVTTESTLDISMPKSRYSDNPICVSEIITDQLIGANDMIRSDDVRARLKEVIPDILNTCPVVDDRLENCQRRGLTSEFPAYAAAEYRRTELFEGFLDYDNHDYVVRMDKFLATVRKAANMYRTSDAQSC